MLLSNTRQPIKPVRPSREQGPPVNRVLLTCGPNGGAPPATQHASKGQTTKFASLVRSSDPTALHSSSMRIDGTGRATWGGDCGSACLPSPDSRLRQHCTSQQQGPTCSPILMPSSRACMQMPSHSTSGAIHPLPLSPKPPLRVGCIRAAVWGLGSAPHPQLLHPSGSPALLPLLLPASTRARSLTVGCSQAEQSFGVPVFVLQCAGQLTVGHSTGLLDIVASQAGLCQQRHETKQS